METEIIAKVIAGIISTGALGLLGLCTRAVYGILKDLKTVKNAQRSMLKGQIVREFEKAELKGYITTLRLETVERAYENYKALDGNSYIDDLMGKLRNSTTYSNDEVKEILAKHEK